MDLLKVVVNRESIPVKELDLKAHFQYQADRWVASAVTQTFSYIIENGLEYGYLGTGEAYMFLRVHKNNPDTVYYRLCIPREEVGKETGWGPDSDHENRLHLTAMSQVSAFCLQAGRRSQGFKSGRRRLARCCPPGTSDLTRRLTRSRRRIAKKWSFLLTNRLSSDSEREISQKRPKSFAQGKPAARLPLAHQPQTAIFATVGLGFSEFAYRIFA